MDKFDINMRQFVLKLVVGIGLLASSTASVACGGCDPEPIKHPPFQPFIDSSY